MIAPNGKLFDLAPWKWCYFGRRNLVNESGRQAMTSPGSTGEGTRKRRNAVTFIFGFPDDRYMYLTGRHSTHAWLSGVPEMYVINCSFQFAFRVRACVRCLCVREWVKCETLSTCMRVGFVPALVRFLARRMGTLSSALRESTFEALFYVWFSLLVIANSFCSWHWLAPAFFVGICTREMKSSRKAGNRYYSKKGNVV